jgi:flagellar biosynthesis/type III secretory pathway chaperone
MSKTTERAQELQGSLEDLLVREFRACQALCAFTKDERRALTIDDVTQLAELVEKKESLLDEIGLVEESRRTVVQELAAEAGAPEHSGTLAALLPVLDPTVAGRLSRLREGILALSSEVRDLTSGNLALTVTAIDRIDAVQTFLLSMCQPQINYQPPGLVPQASPAVWNVDRGI